MLLSKTAYITFTGEIPTMKPAGKGDSSDDAAECKEIDFSKIKVEPLFQDFVDFEEFSKSDFRVVKVLECEEVPKSKKLLQFKLNDGSGVERMILSGIKDYYSAEELVGKTLLSGCLFKCHYNFRLI